MDDLISRAAAIECAIDAVDDWDGGWNPDRETVIRKYFKELPTVPAIPVEWLQQRRDMYMNTITAGNLRVVAEIDHLMREWQKEQEAADHEDY